MKLKSLETLVKEGWVVEIWYDNDGGRGERFSANVTWDRESSPLFHGSGASIEAALKEAIEQAVQERGPKKVKETMEVQVDSEYS